MKKIRKEAIVDKNLNVYGYEILTGMITSIEDDFNNFVMLLKSVNSGKFFYHLNIFPKTLFRYFSYIDKFIKPNVVIELVERNSSLCLQSLLEKLKNSQIKLSIDDFGNGSSNFDRLNLPNIHSVKIDHLWKREDYGLVEFMVKTFKKRNILLIAEKVETEEEFEIAKQLGFDLFQGYYIQKRLKLDDREKEDLSL